MKKPLSLVVTIDGVPFEDQREGLRLFMERAKAGAEPGVLRPSEPTVTEPDPLKRLQDLETRLEIVTQALRRTTDHLHGFADYHPDECTAETEAIFFINQLILEGRFT